MGHIRIMAAAVGLFVLAGCAVLPLADQPATGDGGAVDAGTCGLDTAAALVGTGVDEALTALLPLTTAQPPRARVIFPDQSVTMDYRAERLNVEIGPDDLVRRVYCG